jgi:rare lipoprotein A
MSIGKVLLLFVCVCAMATAAIASDLVTGIFSRAKTAAGAVRGKASWYGEGYRGKTMANGQPFNPDALTCATWDWPLGAVLRIRCVDSLQSVRVTVTDRGPDKRLGRIIDLSRAAFERIANIKVGVVQVEIQQEL